MQSLSGFADKLNCVHSRRIGEERFYGGTIATNGVDLSPSQLPLAMGTENASSRSLEFIARRMPQCVDFSLRHADPSQ